MIANPPASFSRYGTPETEKEEAAVSGQDLETLRLVLLAASALKERGTLTRSDRQTRRSAFSPAALDIPMSSLQVFGLLLARLRSKNRLSLEEVSRKAWITTEDLFMIECGTARLDKIAACLDRLASALDQNPADLSDYLYQLIDRRAGGGI